MKTAYLLIVLTLCSTTVFADMMPGPLPGKAYSIPLPNDEKKITTESPSPVQETESNSKASSASPKSEITTGSQDKVEKLEALVQQQAKTIIQLQEKLDSLEKRVSLIENQKKKK